MPPDTVQLLQTNNRFIESFMVGLNSEMGRELLWRGYPTDQRGTLVPAVLGRDVLRCGRPHPTFRRFTNGASVRSASNARAAAEDHLVLLLRGELLRRYRVSSFTRSRPSCATADACWPPTFPAGVTPPLESHPLFRGTLDADVTFVGFDLTRDKALADAGWFFVLQQQPS